MYDSNFRSTVRLLAVGFVASVVCVFLFGQSRLGETKAEADQNSAGCIACHGQTDSASMHTTGTVRIGCTDCHGGNASIIPPPDSHKGAPDYESAKKKAHPKPSMPDLWRS